jgi:HK97 family phage prohead protease
MPYFITDRHPECDTWALVKEDGELIFCHADKESATNQMVAISLEEGIVPAGEYDGEEFRAALPGDKYTTEAEALDRAEELGCEGTHSMDENGQTIYMPCSTHGRYEELTGTMDTSYRVHEPGHNDDPSTPAPEEDQIEGSDKNKEGSAGGAGGDIELSERTETALRNKVKEHNEEMEELNKPPHTRTTYGQLAAVYRRGSGAFSVSHRPGMSRAQWSMGRVNAYLYLLKNGRPKNAAYVGDNDLLPEAHPKSTRSVDFMETRDVDLTPPSYMRAAARRGVELYEAGQAGDGVTDDTVREARAMAQGNVTADKWAKIAPWIARHIADLDAEQNQPGGDGFPGAGAVAFYLWGVTPTERGATRARAYAESITDRIEQENEGRARGEALSKMETRNTATQFEVREEGDGMTFTGYAAVFNSPSEPLPFIERVAPGAFKRSLRARNEIKMLWNHDTGSILGSVRAGTLKLEEDNHGLKVTASLPNTSVGRDTAELLRRGDVDAMSFGFTVPKGGDSWNAEGSERTLNSVRIHEISVVAFPAYTATSGTATVRGLDKVAERSSVDADALADAIIKLETGEEITPEDTEILNSVIQTLSPKSEVVEPEDNSHRLLELKKAKLKALLGAIND